MNSCGRGKSCKREHLWLQSCTVCSREKPPFFLPPFPSQATITSLPWITRENTWLQLCTVAAEKSLHSFFLSLSLHRLPPPLIPVKLKVRHVMCIMYDSPSTEKQPIPPFLLIDKKIYKKFTRNFQEIERHKIPAFTAFSHLFAVMQKNPRGSLNHLLRALRRWF